VKTFAYVRPTAIDAAEAALGSPDARAMGGGTDLLTQQDRGILPAESVIDLRGLGLNEIDDSGDSLRIGATATMAELGRHPAVAERYTVLHEAVRAAASPQLREMGTVGGNLCQQVRCWYFRHPDLTCWLAGGDTCYAQIGDHRKHGLEAGDCISVAPSDLAGALLALDARVRITGANGERRVPVAALYARPSEQHRSSVQLARNELITAVELPAPPDRSAYERAGERAAWTFALAGIAAARFGGTLRLAAIGLTNEPRLLDPSDPLGGLPGLEQTGWKRELAGVLCERALARVSP
jgi:xanthine dehydrogenase YagS FAD-binding subunit